MYIFMVWEAIQGGGPRILIRFPDRMNSEVLKKGLFLIYESQNIFYHLGDPYYKSKLISSFFNKSKIILISN